MSVGAKRYRKRGRYAACPPLLELQQLAATMTAPQIAKHCDVADSTARAWLAAAGVRAQSVNARQRKQNQGELWRRFGDDRKAIAAYFEIRTLDEITADLGISLATLYKLERLHGCRAKRRCVACGVVKPFSAMVARNDGRPCSRCAECAVKAVGKKQPKAVRDDFEHRLVPSIFFALTRRPISRDTGYRNLYAPEWV